MSRVPAKPLPFTLSLQDRIVSFPNLIFRYDESKPEGDHYDFRISLLPPTSKAAILSDTISVKKPQLDKALEQIGKLTFENVAQVMRDEDDAAPALSHPPQHREQARDLGSRRAAAATYEAGSKPATKAAPPYTSAARRSASTSCKRAAP